MDRSPRGWSISSGVLPSRLSEANIGAAARKASATLSLGPGVDRDHFAVPPKHQGCEVGILLDPRDQHANQLTPQASHDRAHEIVRERPRELDAGQFHRDRARLGGTDPDRKQPLALDFSQRITTGVFEALSRPRLATSTCTRSPDSVSFPSLNADRSGSGSHVPGAQVQFLLRGQGIDIQCPSRPA